MQTISDLLLFSFILSVHEDKHRCVRTFQCTVLRRPLLHWSSSRKFTHLQVLLASIISSAVNIFLLDNKTKLSYLKGIGWLQYFIGKENSVCLTKRTILAHETYEVLYLQYNQTVATLEYAWNGYCTCPREPERIQIMEKWFSQLGDLQNHIRKNLCPTITDQPVG